jgi:hypothetical protein
MKLTMVREVDKYLSSPRTGNSALWQIFSLESPNSKLNQYRCRLQPADLQSCWLLNRLHIQLYLSWADLIWPVGPFKICGELVDFKTFIVYGLKDALIKILFKLNINMALKNKIKTRGI